MILDPRERRSAPTQYGLGAKGDPQSLSPRQLLKIVWDNDGIPPTPDSGGIPTRENHDLEYVSIARTRFYIQALGFFEEYDLLLTPQMPLTAWGVSDWPAQNECNPTLSILDRLTFTFPFYPTGQPAAPVPCGFATDVLPVALQIVGRYHADTHVLQAAAAFEKIAPWTSFWPDVSSGL